MTAVSTALIVGAGPAGLSTAIGLARLGVEVDVAEASPDREVLGSELTLSSANLRALDELGVAETLVALGAGYSRFNVRAADDTLLASVDWPSVARPGLPASLGITRRALHDGLYDAALAAGARIHHGAGLSRLDQSPGFVDATLDRGPSGRYELVVGADGVRSQVRRLVFGDMVEPSYTGQCVWRARVPRRGEACLDMWQGDDVVAGIVTVSDDTSYLFCLVSHETVPRLDRDQFARLLREDLSQFERGLVAWSKDQLTAESHIHFSPMMQLIMPSPWHRGGVLLVGDAAHATTPHIAYGAGLAIEDGVVLADELARSGSLGEVFDRFMERRHARCRMVVDAGVQISEWQQSRRDQSADQAALTDQVWRSLGEPI